VRRALQVRDAAGVRGSVAAIIPISFRDEHIELVHGAGGKASRPLIEGLIALHLMNGSAAPLGDAAIVALRSSAIRCRASADMNELYGTPSCPFTAELRDDLEWRGIAFAEYDVETDRAALARMLALANGERTVPVFVEDGSVKHVGFRGRGCIVGGL
jgi:mycoredoxin